VGHDFEDAIVGQLIRGEGSERFAFREHAAAILARALDRELDRPDPLHDVRAALKLSAALDGPLASPSAAAQLRELLRADPRARRLIETEVLDEQPIDRARSFVKSEGREVAAGAPAIAAAAPAHTVPLKDLLVHMKPIRRGE
jgi:hypothetical protein